VTNTNQKKLEIACDNEQEMLDWIDKIRSCASNAQQVVIIVCLVQWLGKLPPGFNLGFHPSFGLKIGKKPGGHWGFGLFQFLGFQLGFGLKKAGNFRDPIGFGHSNHLVGQDLKN